MLAMGAGVPQSPFLHCSPCSHAEAMGAVAPCHGKEAEIQEGKGRPQPEVSLQSSVGTLPIALGH